MSKPETKFIIVKAATRYFSKYGFYKTTMDEIAKHIHKAKGVLYYHFNSKEELFSEVLKQELDKVKIALSKVVGQNCDSLIMLKDYIFTRLELLNRSVNYHETLKADFFEEYHFVEEVREDFAKFEKEKIQYILQRGQQEGTLDISDIGTTAKIVLMVLTSIELPLFLQDKYSEYVNAGEELADLIIKGLKS